jgi:hypothetical protein
MKTKTPKQENATIAELENRVRALENAMRQMQQQLHTQGVHIPPPALGR